MQPAPKVLLRFITLVCPLSLDFFALPCQDTFCFGSKFFSAGGTYKMHADCDDLLVPARPLLLGMTSPWSFTHIFRERARSPRGGSLFVFAVVGVVGGSSRKGRLSCAEEVAQS